MKIPSGWYFCEESSAIAKGQVLSKELFGQKLVLWRTDSGAVYVSDAACPHLGSDLGKLGKVSGETLQCFSHGFTYDGKGDCIKTASKAAPCRSKSVLYHYPVHEVSGFILVWYDALRKAPTWRIPDEIFDSRGKGEFVKSQYTFDVGVDVINQDNFDVGHLYSFHQLDEVTTSPVSVSGPTISITHDFKRHSILFKEPLPPPFDVLSQEVVSRYGSTLYGHGLTYSHIDLPKFDFYTQDFIFPTPLGPDRTLYTTFLRRVLPEGKRTTRQMIQDKLLHPVLFQMFLLRLRQEHVTEGKGYWEAKSRIESPILTDQERELIGPYQAWCRQFTSPLKLDLAAE